MVHGTDGFIGEGGTPPAPGAGGGRLRRELRLWEVIGISVALMAPSMAANINPQGTAQTVGRAVPLAFVLATVGVLLVSWTFVQLCRRFHHSGSVYGFVGATLGARAGVVAGWGLLGTYTFYGVVTSMASGIFGSAFLDAVGIWNDPPAWAGFLIGGLALAGVYLLTVSPVRQGTRVLLSVEVVTVALILVVTAVVLVRLAIGTAPDDRGLTLSPFTVPSGIDTSTLFLGAVFGFLSFAGFEAAATLGEEAREPRRDIPRAILGTAIFGGVYFIVVTWVEVMAFGPDEKGVTAFGSSGSLLGDLGTRYIGAWVGDIITLGAAVSAFGCALACSVGASRLLFALSRDGVLPTRLGEVSPGRRTPAAAATVIAATIAAIVVVSWAAFGAEPFDLFFYSGTIGTLILLVAYALATIGAVRLVFFSDDPRADEVPRWQIAVPTLALVVLGYTLYRNVVPYPEGTSGWMPVVCGAWLLAAVVFVLVRPRLAEQAGRRLTADEGLAGGAGDRDRPVGTGEVV
jgi:amino acid transporter